MPSKKPTYNESVEYMNNIDQDTILAIFPPKKYAKAIEQLNQLIFQKRCAPQRPIEATTLMEHDAFKLVVRIISEYRMEFYAFYGSVDVPVTIEGLQAASNRAGCTQKIEFNE